MDTSNHDGYNVVVCYTRLRPDRGESMPRKNTVLKVVEDQPPQPLNEREKKFIDLLLTGKTISDAAIAVGLRRSHAFYSMINTHSDL